MSTSAFDDGGFCLRRSAVGKTKPLGRLLRWRPGLRCGVQGEGKTSERGFIVLASFALVAAILYFSKAVFIPFALALLFTFLLSPLVILLQKWKFPKALAITVTVTSTFALIAFVTWLVATQVIGLAGQLPKYEQNLHAKVKALKGTQRPDVFTRAADIIKNVQKDFEVSSVDPANPAPEPGTGERPLAVEVKPSKPSAWQLVGRTLGPLLGPAGTAGIVVLLVLAMLFKREDLRDRFIKVISGGQLNTATEAVDDAARRISRYLVMNLVVNATYGVPIGLGLYFIGVPNALLWGLLATLLRFIPFLGPWIAALFPVALAFAVDPGWSKLLLTISLFLVMELISNNLVEPWLYGASTGVSSVAIIGGALFWTWLWGPIGLFLCTPLTVCLVVMGKYVPGLKFLSDMFGSEPVLEPHARFYQRMLAMDAEEMMRIAEEFLETHDLITFYDQVMIPALILAEEDRQTGHLAEIRQQFIVQNSRELIEDLGEKECVKRGYPLANFGAMPEVVCLPAKDEADEIAAVMLVQVLHAEGISAQVIAATIQPGQCESYLQRGNFRSVVISALPPAALAPARRLGRNLKESCPSLPVMIGLWTPISASTDIKQRLVSIRADAIFTTLKSAVQQLTAKDRQPTATPAATPSIAPVPVDVSTLEACEPEELFDQVKRDVARIFDVPLAFVSIVELDVDFWKDHAAELHDAEEENGLLRNSCVCAQVSDAAEPVVIEDVSKDKSLATDTFLLTRGIQSYVSAPLRTESGHTVGSLCVLDTKPRSITETELAPLRTVAESLMRSIESRRLHPA